MIRGVGIDVVEIRRIEEMISHWGPRFTKRVFTEEELSDSADRADRAASLAARFAAKEAFAKALGTGWDSNFNWQDFSIRKQASGQPTAILSASMRKRLLGVRILVSLSHSDTHAVAVVVLEDVEVRDG